MHDIGIPFLCATNNLYTTLTAAVLIKEEEQKGGNSAASPLAAIQDLGMFSMTNNFDNEVEILHSRTLIKKAVNELRLYTTIAEDRITGYNIPLYRTSPVNVFMTPEEADKLEAPVKLKMKYTLDGKLHVHAKYVIDEEGDEERNRKRIRPVTRHTSYTGRRH